MRFDNLIFDLDGTLVDSFQDIYSSLNAATEHFNLPAPSEEMVRKSMHLRLDQLVESMYPTGNRDRIMMEFRNNYDSSGYLHTHPYPDVDEIIHHLKEKGCRLFVVTNKRKVAAVAILSRYRMRKDIEEIYTSDITSPPLSKDEIVHRLIIEKRLDTTRTALVGDTRSDYNAALYNDLFFIYSAYGYGEQGLISINMAKAAYIDSFTKLISIIENTNL